MVTALRMRVLLVTSLGALGALGAAGTAAAATITVTVGGALNVGEPVPLVATGTLDAEEAYGVDITVFPGHTRTCPQGHRQEGPPYYDDDHEQPLIGSATGPGPFTVEASWAPPAAGAYRICGQVHSLEDYTAGYASSTLDVWVGDPPPPDPTPTPTPTPPPPPENRPPVAQPDTWTVRAGQTLEETVLTNDFDPDGDPITPRVTSISFAAKEWSGMEPDGGFLYTAGPGTAKVMRKQITYHVVDAKGAASAPTTAVVEVRPPEGAKRTPKKVVKRKPRAGASAARPWYGPYGWARLCFGSGLKTKCYTMLSVSRTAAFNATVGWATFDGAVQACLKFGLLPMKNRDCAQALLQKGLGGVWDKSVVRNAANFGDCLMFRVPRKRTLAHPLRGEWGSPEYHPTESLVGTYSGNQRVTGYGTWPKGLFGAKWRVPLFCTANGNVFSQPNQPLVEV